MLAMLVGTLAAERYIARTASLCAVAEVVRLRSRYPVITRTVSFANLPCVCICPSSVCRFCDRPFEVLPLSLSAQRRAEFDHCFEKKIDLRQGQPGKLLYLKGFALTADSETDKLACQIAGVGGAWSASPQTRSRSSCKIGEAETA